MRQFPTRKGTPLQKKQLHDASRSSFKSRPTPYGVFFQPIDFRGHSGTEARRKPLTSAAEREVSGGLTTTFVSSGHQRQHTAKEAFAVRLRRAKYQRARVVFG